jgi:hypothetical protein
VYGQGYMLYLAFRVKAPGMTHNGLLSALNGGVTGRGADAAAIANWEYWGELSAAAMKTKTKVFAVQPMWWGSKKGNMDLDVSTSIARGVPVFTTRSDCSDW